MLFALKEPQGWRVFKGVHLFLAKEGFGDAVSELFTWLGSDWS